ncbi:alpha/beta hydrolase family protein [Streptomyces roseifaciens]|uniref:alpha/beta hydrolase family protein n=1 Tax=Streptomyces roseifaciens TaxID=1488406 RepID=UPI0007C778C3|nr:dienelactone hydrolase family protein [Streptomyces roseifaciens]
MLWKSRKTSRRSFVAAALLMAFAAPQMPAVAAAAERTPGPAAPGTPAEVPAPTGKMPVGTKTLHLVDTSRPDPWKPAAGKRQLMVSLWYPARHQGDKNAPYVSKELSKAVLGKEDLAGVRTNSTLDAEPAGKPRPLVVLSPGFGMSRLTLTALGEDLASRGYAVAAVDHTYEAPVEFPGGRIETCETCAKPDMAAVVRNRAKDFSFLLDRLTAPGSPLAVDRGRIAVVGHSIGGASAVEALRGDKRVDAAVNLDGNFPIDLPAEGLKKPVMLFGAQRSGDDAENWNKNWQRLTGWKRWLDVPEGGHLTFTDAPWIADRFGMPDQIPPEQVHGAYGSLHGIRSTALTRAYVNAFVDRHLRGTPSPLLDRPSAAYPEVTVLKKK